MTLYQLFKTTIVCRHAQAIIGVRDNAVSFGGGGGGLRSLVITFPPVFARKSSGFARILLVFCPEMATI